MKTPCTTTRRSIASFTSGSRKFGRSSLPNSVMLHIQRRCTYEVLDSHYVIVFRQSLDGWLALARMRPLVVARTRSDSLDCARTLERDQWRRIRIVTRSHGNNKRDLKTKTLSSNSSQSATSSTYTIRVSIQKGM